MLRTLLSTGIVLARLVVANAAQAQTANVTTEAFRDRVANAGRKLAALVAVTPNDKLDYRPTPPQRTLAEVATQAASQTQYACGRIAGLRVGRNDQTPTTKSDLINRINAAFAACDTLLRTVRDSALGDTRVVDMRAPVGPPPPITSAAAMYATIDMLGETVGTLSQYLRLLGIAPPRPCGAFDLDDPDCGSKDAHPRCFNENLGGLSGFAGSITMLDDNRGVRSDGRGTYKQGSSGVVNSTISWALVLAYGRPLPEGSTPRGIVVDLSRPAAAGGGTAYGIYTVTTRGEVAAQLAERSDHSMPNFLDIPVGTSVPAAQLGVEFWIDGVEHLLQFGPQPVGHCSSDAPSIHGQGTSAATISRPLPGKWIVDVPAGSSARLWNVRLGYTNATDEGLYTSSIHFEFDGTPPVGFPVLRAAHLAGIDSALRLYAQLRKTQSSDWRFDEGQLNEVGYELLRGGRVSDAVRIFELNVQEYPSASNPYDSLGEAYLMAGDTTRAIASYRRSVQLNPKNENGVVVLRRLGAKP